MVKSREAENPNANAGWGKFDQTVMVLQGGGALGAYQAGVYAYNRSIPCVRS
ncbi:hypothetical protein [Paraburkholderia sediminicola]|uniref:hypothetical protein n=1 Tax=Paraburkholderia sediminicola TaxID=458836 RepID=UPI0038BDA104